jgi:hypothetical protein
MELSSDTRFDLPVGREENTFTCGQAAVHPAGVKMAAGQENSRQRASGKTFLTAAMLRQNRTVVNF